MTQPITKEHELAIFTGFAEACPLPIRTATVRQLSPPRADVTCKVWPYRAIDFELVQIVDQGAQVKLMTKLLSEKEIHEARMRMPESAQSSLEHKSVLIEFVDDVSKNLRRNAIGRLLSAVSAASPDAGRIPVPKALRNVVRRMTVQPSPIRHTRIGVGSFVRYGDPILDRIAEKLDKSYETTGRLELIAYYDGQDALPFELQREDVGGRVAARLRRSAFDRVWVYDHRKRQILFVHPEWRWGCFSIVRQDL